MLLFQEIIALRFGFIPCKGNANSYQHHSQFVHVTGTPFLLSSYFFVSYLLRGQIYSDSQNYIYSGKFFFLGLPCSGKKGGKCWKNLFELNKQVSIRKTTLLKVK